MCVQLIEENSAKVRLSKSGVFYSEVRLVSDSLSSIDQCKNFMTNENNRDCTVRHELSMAMDYAHLKTFDIFP